MEKMSSVLPAEVLTEIFTLLDRRSFLNASLACKFWFSVSCADSFWKEVYLRCNVSQKEINWSEVIGFASFVKQLPRLPTFGKDYGRYILKNQELAQKDFKIGLMNCLSSTGHTPFIDRLFTINQQGKKSAAYELLRKKMSDRTLPRMAIKLVVVGDDYNGKTCLLISYTTNEFPTGYVPTVFDNYSSGYAPGPSLGLWDTAGAPDYDRLRPLSYPQTDVFILTYAVDSRKSFENVTSKWYPELVMFNGQVPVILLGTKLDRRKGDVDCVSYSEGIRRAVEIGAIGFMECSAITKENLTEVFNLALQLGIAAQLDLQALQEKERNKKRCSIS